MRARRGPRISRARARTWSSTPSSAIRASRGRVNTGNGIWVMGKRSKITQLPREVKAWLDQALIEGNFAGYQALEADLKSRGYDIGKSSIHRYGTHLERKLSAIKASTEAARQIAAAAPDDADQRSAAVISLIQT